MYFRIYLVHSRNEKIRNPEGRVSFVGWSSIFLGLEAASTAPQPNQRLAIDSETARIRKVSDGSAKTNMAAADQGDRYKDDHGHDWCLRSFRSQWKRLKSNRETR